VNDDTVTSLARTMPKRILALGDKPCSEIRTGVTVKGVAALADYYPGLYTLRVRFQVASLATPPASGGIPPNPGPTALRRDCALTELEVVEMPFPGEEASAITITVARIFPRPDYIHYIDENWEEVIDVTSRQFIDPSSEQYSSLHFDVALMTPP